MAEQIPYAVAASLIVRLASTAFRELGRIYGVTDELERLRITVESIKAVLLDAEERQERDRAVQLWITRLKDVLYPAEDLLDEFAIDVMRHNPADSSGKNRFAKVLHSLSPKRVAFRGEMAHKIEKVRKLFEDVVQEMSRLNFIPKTVVVEQTDSVRRETASFVLESDIIGRENSKKEIIGLLTQPNQSQNISSVAIVGIGGLGKTALAQLVYNDDVVKEKFEKRIWVCVSDNFDVKTIVKNMLESLTKNKVDDNLSFDTLQNRLVENLSGKTYLLVLDDTWNESCQKWTQLRAYLMCGAHGSRILVTTRSKIVAQTMGVSVPYVLNGLTQDESWSLLKNITFGDDIIRMNQNLESIGKKIAEKCRGVPLAIRTMGGLLHGKSEKSEWMDILQGDFWRLCEDEESIIPVLKLSYQNLSPQMRQCFAYCCLYPKDWEIKKDELIELWMAQGYLECSGQKQLMEDVGNQFIKIFLMKSFFQDAKMTEHDEIDSFKMHDLMHDLAMQVAGNDCCCLDGDRESLVGRPLHVWLAAGTLDLLGSLDGSRLRTLILTASELSEKELSLVSNFKYLRALSLWSPSRRLPDSVGMWKHLRYLHLPQSSGMESLPRSISNLVCLQTLRLGDCYKLEFPKNDASKLISLRHLDTFYGADSKNFEASSTVTKLGCSNWLSSLTNIVEISLKKCKYGGNIPPLERLPFLKSLVIDSLVELEYIYYQEDLLPGGTFFPSLETLKFTRCFVLRGWCKMGDDLNDTKSSHHLSFPSLSHLSIRNCKRLTHMPTFPNLDKSLTLVRCLMEPLVATLQNIAAVDSTPLSMLSSLCIDGATPDRIKLPEHWMKNLTSLQYLELISFPSQAFQEMEIYFKDEIHCFPSLKKFIISSSSELEALPDWICNISSLQHIKLVRCSSLESLPEGVPCLTNLQTLEICYCGDLVGKCRSETSATRRKIAHIPNIILKERASFGPYGW